MAMNDIDNTEEREPTQSRDNLVISRAPSKAWIPILVVLGSAAILLQSPGLHSLVAFNSRKEQWVAAEAQRESLRREWDEMLEDLQAKVNNSQKELAQVDARLKTIQEDYDEENNKLTKMKELCNLAEQSRDEADSERIKAKSETQSLIAEQTQIRDQISRLTKEKVLLDEKIVLLNEQARSAEQSCEDKNTELARIKSVLKETQSELAETQQAVQTAQDNLRTTHSRCLEVLEEQKGALQKKADAEAETSRAAAALAKLQSDMEEIRKLTSQKDALKTQIDTLSATLAGLETQQYELIQDVTQAELVLEKEKQVLAVVLGTKGELEAQVGSEQTVLADLKDRKTTTTAEIEALRKSRESLQKAHGELVQHIEIAEESLRKDKIALAKVSGEKATLDTLISAEQDALSDLSRRKAKLVSEIEALRKQRDDLVKEVEEGKAENGAPANASPPAGEGSQTATVDGTKREGNS
jgi:chromosome segregation ATPase